MAFTKINAAGIGTTETVTVDGLTVINDGSFGGNLTVSGVLTYEDVTNVDSVGLITARNGIVVGSGITLSKDGDIFATGITTISGNVKVGTGITLSKDGDGFFTGVVTATSFVGDGSGLTNAGPSLTGSTDNTIVTVTGANALQGESNLTFDGSKLTVTSSSKDLLYLNSTHTSGPQIPIQTSGTTFSYIGSAISLFSTGSSTDLGIRAESSKNILFGIAGNEKLRIDSSGRLLIGTTTEGVVNGDDLTIATSGNTGLSIRSGTSSQGNIFFSDGTSGADEYRGYFQYLHATNALLIGTDGSERARLTSEGKLGINISSPVTIIHANGNSTVGTSVTMTLQSHDTANSTAGIDLLARDNSNNNETCRVIAASGGAETVSLQFHTNDAEKMRITNDGKVGIGDASPDALLVIKGDSDSATTPSIRLKDGSDTRECWITNNSGDLMLVNGGDDNTPHCKITLLDGNLMTFATANTERMRLTSSGALNIGASSDTGIFLNVNQPNATGGHSVHIKAGASSSYSSAFACRVTCHGFYTNSYNNGGILFVNEDDTSHNRNAQAARFLNNDGTNVGAVLFNTSSTSYSTSSDYRLKENETPISDAITRLKTLKPYRFNFKATPSETIDGFFAHEVTTVPNAITGTKDQVDSDGNPLYQSMDHAKLVPLLTAALQEAVARIEALEG